MTPVEMPPFLTPYQGNSRLRSSHLDYLCYESSISPRTIYNAFSKSFFYKTHLEWNRLPLKLREIVDPSTFKTKLMEHLWTAVSNELLSDDLCQ